MLQDKLYLLSSCGRHTFMDVDIDCKVLESNDDLSCCSPTNVLILTSLYCRASE